jgi:hypothetical protein
VCGWCVFGGVLVGGRVRQAAAPLSGQCDRGCLTTCQKPRESTTSARWIQSSSRFCNLQGSCRQAEPHLTATLPYLSRSTKGSRERLSHSWTYTTLYPWTCALLPYPNLQYVKAKYQPQDNLRPAEGRNPKEGLSRHVPATISVQNHNSLGSLTTHISPR